jgi:hypothetical protein
MNCSSWSEIWCSYGGEDGVVVFCAVTPCGLVFRYQRFEETCCPHLQGWRWKQYVPPKRWYPPANLHGVTTHKNNIVMKCLNLILSKCYKCTFGVSMENAGFALRELVHSRTQDLNVSDTDPFGPVKVKVSRWAGESRSLVDKAFCLRQNPAVTAVPVAMVAFISVFNDAWLYSVA